MADFEAGISLSDDSSSKSHSRQSSLNSDRSHGTDKENTSADSNSATRKTYGSDYDKVSLGGDNRVDKNSAYDTLILKDGQQLIEESKTERLVFYVNPGCSEPGANRNSPGIPARIPIQSSTSGGGTARAIAKNSKSNPVIPEVDISIPSDGSLASFSADDMATFFRSMHIEERLISHLHRTCTLDGKKFARLKDSDLETLNLKNPVIVYFRDRSAATVSTKKSKTRVPFVL